MHYSRSAGKAAGPRLVHAPGCLFISVQVMTLLWWRSILLVSACTHATEWQALDEDG